LGYGLGAQEQGSAIRSSGCERGKVFGAAAEGSIPFASSKFRNINDLQSATTGQNSQIGTFSRNKFGLFETVRDCIWQFRKAKLWAHGRLHTAPSAFKHSGPVHSLSRVHTTTSPSRPSVAGRTTIHLAPTATSLNRPLRKASIKSSHACSRFCSVMLGSLLPMPAASGELDGEKMNGQTVATKATPETIAALSVTGCHRLIEVRFLLGMIPAEIVSAAKRRGSRTKRGIVAISVDSVSKSEAEITIRR